MVRPFGSLAVLVLYWALQRRRLVYWAMTGLWLALALRWQTGADLPAASFAMAIIDGADAQRRPTSTDVAHSISRRTTLRQ